MPSMGPCAVNRLLAPDTPAVKFDARPWPARRGKICLPTPFLPMALTAPHLPWPEKNQCHPQGKIDFLLLSRVAHGGMSIPLSRQETGRETYAYQLR
jgi:hypothetical protein